MPRWIPAWQLVGLAILSLLSTPLSATDGLERDRFAAIVTEHLLAYPEMGPQDLYKLSFQAAMGIGHALPDRASARNWLDRELAGLEGTSEEPLCMPLSPDGALIRIELRAFLRRNGRVDGLLEAMEATADRFQGSEETLVRYWGYLEELAEAGEIPFATDELVDFFSNLQDQGYPGVHHSETYRELYEPAYRVVLRQLVPLAVGEGCPPD